MTDLDTNAKIAVIESQNKDFKEIMEKQSVILKDGFDGIKDILNKMDRRVLTLEIEYPNTQKKIEDLQSSVEDNRYTLTNTNKTLNEYINKFNGVVWIVKGAFGTSLLAAGSVLTKWIW